MPTRCLLLLIQLLVAVGTNCIAVGRFGTDLSRPVFEGVFSGFQQGKQEGEKGGGRGTDGENNRVDSGSVF